MEAGLYHLSGLVEMAAFRLMKKGCVWLSIGYTSVHAHSSLFGSMVVEATHKPDMDCEL